MHVGIAAICRPNQPAIFDVDTINLNGSTQYLNGGDNFDLGTQALSISFWVDADSTFQFAYKKGDLYPSNANGVSVYISDSNAVRVVYGRKIGGIYIWQFWTTTATMSNGKHYVTIYDDRSSKNRTVKVYVDGVDFGGGSWTNSGDPDFTGFDFSSSDDLWIGLDRLQSGTYLYRKCGHFIGLAWGEELTLADHQYMYNDGEPLCWDTMIAKESDIADKFTAFFELGTYDGRTEIQALTDRVADTVVLTNINSAPFNGDYLTIECND